MASLNTATNRVLTGGFVMQAALVAAGLAASSMATDWIRGNVIDLQMQGADAVYGVVAALAIAFSSTVGVPWKYARPVSLGVAAGGIYNEAQAMDLV